MSKSKIPDQELERVAGEVGMGVEQLDDLMVRLRDSLAAARPTDETADLEDRIRLLRAASRTNEPLTASDGPTAQGHILSAISKLERRREELYRAKR